jgi:hypothetical protein
VLFGTVCVSGLYVPKKAVIIAGCAIGEKVYVLFVLSFGNDCVVHVSVDV